MPNLCLPQPKEFDRLLGGLRKGMSLRAACNLAGISVRAVKQLVQEGQEYMDNPNISVNDLTAEMIAIMDFARIVLQTQAMCEETHITYIETAAKSDWKAAHTMLKKINPRDWNENWKQPADEAKETAQVQFNLDKLEPDELELLEKLLNKMGANISADVENQKQIGGPPRPVARDGFIDATPRLEQAASHRGGKIAIAEGE